jgi:hypothetical protein
VLIKGDFLAVNAIFFKIDQIPTKKGTPCDVPSLNV